MIYSEVEKLKKAGIMAIAAALTLVSGVSAAAGSGRTPLLQEGKKTLFERVITRPDCRLSGKPGSADGEGVLPFSRFYVYSRNSGYLEVGPDSRGHVSGWLEESCTIPWKMQMTAFFTNRVGRERALMYKDKKTLDDIVMSEKALSIEKSARASLGKGGSATVVSEEPEAFVNWQEPGKFYLLPILDSAEQMTADGNYVRELNVASLSMAPANGKGGAGAAGSASSSGKSGSAGSSKGASADAAGGADSGQGDPNSVGIFRAGIVFVVDTTVSMQTYLDQTREIVKDFYKALDEAGMAQFAGFGLIGFRSDTKAVPGLEYTTKIFVDPNDVEGSEDFLKKTEQLRAATVSSPLFDEDSFAGVAEAVNSIDWSGFDGRYVVLITDAGAIDGGSEHASTGYSAETLKADLQQKHIGLIAIHLLSGTANAKKNREGAKAQYEILSDNSFLNKPLYFQTDTADKTGFRKQVTKISDLLTAQTLHAYNGDKSIGSVITEVQEEAKKVGDNDIKRLGLAMQLEYLGKISGTRAPSVISSWISDLDLTPQHRAVVEPYVLLTKTDLSNMAGRVSGVMKAASAGVRSPDAMFNQLKDIALKMGRDPSELNGKTAFSDAVMAEYLEGLPYRSEVAAMDAEDWASLSPDQQEKFLRNMNNKLRFYRKCNEDTDKWISLAEGADHADDVYPVPLSMLP